jgi:SHAQKYF class myb-like DNA-binding protein
MATSTEGGGEWTTAEHEAFLEGLEKFGQAASREDVWIQIAASVGTKTSEQVRDHAQNYFVQLQTESFSSPDVRWALLVGLEAWPFERRDWLTQKELLKGTVLFLIWQQ